jgi:hypothetical protein
VGELYYGFVIIRLSSGEELAANSDTEVRKVGRTDRVSSCYLFRVRLGFKRSVLT